LEKTTLTNEEIARMEDYIQENPAKTLCSTKRTANTEVIQVNTATEKKCPMCAELVKAERKICRFCNYGFEEQPQG
jgi:hypothetical protein